MRLLAPVIALAWVLVPSLATAAEDFVVLHDWTTGESVAGVTTLAPAAPAPLGHALAFDVDACHPRLFLDLLYDPAELALAVEGVGEAALGYRFRAQAWQNGSLVGERTIGSPGYGHALAVVPEAGAVEVRFWLVDGAKVSWDARVRGRLAIDDPACQDPL